MTIDQAIEISAWVPVWFEDVIADTRLRLREHGYTPTTIRYLTAEEMVRFWPQQGEERVLAYLYYDGHPQHTYASMQLRFHLVTLHEIVLDHYGAFRRKAKRRFD